MDIENLLNQICIDGASLITAYKNQDLDSMAMLVRDIKETVENVETMLDEEKLLHG